MRAKYLFKLVLSTCLILPLNTVATGTLPEKDSIEVLEEVRKEVPDEFPEKVREKVREKVQIAVAANFAHTLRDVARAFEQIEPYNATIITASSGVLYNQIRNGAPFDLFFSADADRPKRLEAETGTSSFVYAIGRLVFWLPGQRIVTRDSLAQFKGRLAIANPELAPYGKAAIQVIRVVNRQNLTLIRGNNVSQAYQFVQSGNAAAGMIPLSMVLQEKELSYWLIPQALHEPIEQRGILIDTNNSGAVSFLAFFHSSAASKTITEAGYELP